MLREYKDGVKSGVNYFIGYEVENTSMYQSKTLFVTYGSKISNLVELAKSVECEHIYLGANKSITIFNVNWEEINFIIKQLTENNLDVTLDLPYNLYLEAVSSLVPNKRLHLNISVEMPKVEDFGIKNVNIKVDDIDFASTNSGVWVFNLSDKDSFTSWEEYKEDKVI